MHNLASLAFIIAKYMFQAVCLFFSDEHFSNFSKKISDISVMEGSPMKLLLAGKSSEEALFYSHFKDY